MKYIKTYKIFESSSISKEDLVDDLIFLSTYVETYMKDTNKFTTNNLQFSFSYHTELTIYEIFEASKHLNHDSTDGLIRALCNEFIIWGNFFTKGWNIKSDFKLDDNYLTYTDDIKERNARHLYNQDIRNNIYFLVGKKIKELISGTIWDIPTTKSKFTEDDKYFILDCLISDYDREFNLDMISTKSLTNGMSVLLPFERYGRDISYDSEFIDRLQSYFGGVLIKSNKNIYLPFYEY